MPPSLGRRHMLAGLAGLPLLAGAPLSAASSSRPSLAAAAAENGRYFGAAARIEQIRTEEGLRAAILRDCAWITPEIHMKWDAVAPRPDAFAFDAADGLVEFAHRYGLKVRGHALLWDQSTPAWARSALGGSRGWSYLERHFEAVIGRYRGHVAEWDVVNEPIHAEGAGLRPNLFRRAFGPDYIRRALETARAIAPEARLAINDYGFDYDNPAEHDRRRAFLRLLEDLKAQGAPLDAVGVQAHLDLGKGPLKPEILVPFFQRIADLGLKIAITELDVREHDLDLPIAERDRRVAQEARTYLDIALAQPAVEGVVTWGLSDRHSWLQDRPAAGQGSRNRGLPYDDALQPKPMYWALRASLADAPPA